MVTAAEICNQKLNGSWFYREAIVKACSQVYSLKKDHYGNPLAPQQQLSIFNATTVHKWTGMNFFTTALNSEIIRTRSSADTNPFVERNRSNDDHLGLIVHRVHERTLDVIIAFQGSGSVKTWKTDFSVASQDIMSFHPHDPGMRHIREFFHGRDDAVCHRGFLRATLSSQVEILEVLGRLIQQNENNVDQLNVVVTGHSLGGAMATIFAAPLKSWLKTCPLPHSLQLITFGSPRVFAKSCAKTFEAGLGGTAQITRVALVCSTPLWRTLDPVTQIPDNFGHVGGKRCDVECRDVTTGFHLMRGYENFLTHGEVREEPSPDFEPSLPSPNVFYQIAWYYGDQKLVLNEAHADSSNEIRKASIKVASFFFSGESRHEVGIRHLEDRFSFNPNYVSHRSWRFEYQEATDTYRIINQASGRELNVWNAEDRAETHRLTCEARTHDNSFSSHREFLIELHPDGGYYLTNRGSNQAIQILSSEKKVVTAVKQRSEAFRWILIPK